MELLEFFKLLMDSHEFEIFSIDPTKLLEFRKVNVVRVNLFLNYALTLCFLVANRPKFALFS